MSGGYRAVCVRWSFEASTKSHTLTPMAKTNIELCEFLAKDDQGDFQRGIAEAVLQLIMEADVGSIIGAGRPKAVTKAGPGATPIDAETFEIMAVEMAGKRIGNAAMVSVLLRQIPPNQCIGTCHRQW